MKQILFAWIGNTDLKASNGDENIGNGPIGQAVKAVPYHQVYLISNYSNQETNRYAEWLKSISNSNIVVKEVQLSYPTDFEGIYNNIVKILSEARMKWKENDFSFTYHLSPGTPAMASIWLLLAKTIYKANLIESSKERGVRAVDIPFDISIEYKGPNTPSYYDSGLTKIIQSLPPETPEFSYIVHRCKEMRKAVVTARRLALHDVPVIIQGESGTGKELFARAIHSSSIRKKKPFIAFNCGAIPEQLLESELFGHVKGAFTGAVRDHAGYFEKAHGGTLFLDEIGELPHSAQVKFLRALQEMEIQRVGDENKIQIDVRIIAATNKNLIEEMAKGQFREDLFHRIAVGIINLPPLRERSGDLNLLIDTTLNEVNNELSKEPGWKFKNISAGARNLLLNHQWYGNVRELKNTISRAAIWSSSEIINSDDVGCSLLSVKKTDGSSDNILGYEIGDDFSLPEIIGVVARHYLELAFNKAKGNKTVAAKMVGLNSYQTFSDWMKRYGI